MKTIAILTALISHDPRPADIVSFDVPELPRGVSQILSDAKEHSGETLGTIRTSGVCVDREGVALSALIVKDFSAYARQVVYVFHHNRTHLTIHVAVKDAGGKRQTDCELFTVPKRVNGRDVDVHCVRTITLRTYRGRLPAESCYSRCGCSRCRCDDPRRPFPPDVPPASVYAF